MLSQAGGDLSAAVSGQLDDQSSDTPSDAAPLGYGPKVDIWSLGMCLVELADGVLPWADQSPLAVLYKLSSPTLALDLPTSQTVSPACRAFIVACLATQPAQRLSATEAHQNDWLSSASCSRYCNREFLRGSKRLFRERSPGAKSSLPRSCCGASRDGWKP